MTLCCWFTCYPQSDRTALMVAIENGFADICAEILDHEQKRFMKDANHDNHKYLSPRDKVRIGS